LSRNQVSAIQFRLAPHGTAAAPCGGGSAAEFPDGMRDPAQTKGESVREKMRQEPPEGDHAVSAE